MIYLLPFISALIGYLTNYIAVKMLFHPRKPVRILWFHIQGVFPKRQQALADSLGKVVARELISFKDLHSKLTGDKARDLIKKEIDERVEDFLDNRLLSALPMISMFINDRLRGRIKELMIREINPAVDKALFSMADNLEETINIREMVTQRVSTFSSARLEEILKKLMSKEFQTIELVGGLLGFMIGLVQLLLLKLPVLWTGLVSLFT